MRALIMAAAVLAPVAGGVPAHAQLLNSLKGASGMGGGLGGMSMPSVGSASSGNIAGVLQYCMKNNYLGSGSNAGTTESSLLGKLGHGTTSSSQYESGSQGQLQTGNGQTMSLDAGGGSGGGGLKAKLTQKVCDQVLQHAKSML